MPSTIKQEVIDSIAAIRTQLMPGVTGQDRDRLIDAYIDDKRTKRELLD